MKPRNPTPSPATPAPRRRKPPPAANPLRQPEARWQRFNRYVWDKKR